MVMPHEVNSSCEIIYLLAFTSYTNSLIKPLKYFLHIAKPWNTKNCKVIVSRCLLGNLLISSYLWLCTNTPWKKVH